VDEAVQFGVLTGVWIFGGRPARCPQLAERRVQRVQVGGGHELVHPHGRFKIVLGPATAVPGWHDVTFCRDLVSVQRA
jgi:hypothetical protein